jgi:hypothetical protein
MERLVNKVLPSHFCSDPHGLHPQQCQTHKPPRYDPAPPLPAPASPRACPPSAQRQMRDVPCRSYWPPA